MAQLPTIVVAIIALIQTAVLLNVFTVLISSLDNLTNAVWIHLGLGLVTLLSVSVFHAPYGRYAKDTIVDITVDTRAAWILQEMPTLIAVYFHLALQGGGNNDDYATVLLSPERVVYRVLDGIQATNSFALLAMSLYVAHYVHRTFVFPFMIKPRNPTPLHVMLLANLYCSFNGTLQAAALIRFSSSLSSSDLCWTAFGVAVFVTGMFVNIHSDYTLIALRKKSQGYSIPRGLGYEWVSCPNFFGEAVEWLGYSITVLGVCGGPTSAAILDCGSASSTVFLAAFSFFLYTISNTFPRGVKHHQWYLETFGDAYQALGRKAVIPLLW